MSQHQPGGAAAGEKKNAGSESRDQSGAGSESRPAQRADRNRYRDTLNLPRTAFAMKANLLQNEPQSLKRWEKLGLYRRLRERAGEQPRGRFLFHDGPPYANGSIHLGHLMNKCLKDFVVRTREMAGWDTPYVPGWDCHGLPIEHRVMTALVESGKVEKLHGLDEDTRRLAIRRECEKYATKFQKLQAQQMQRLLTLADYDDPYLTMQPAYEGAVLEVLAAMVERGVVYRALKPVHWSIANETALAEAELEYMDREDPSVYVDFEAFDADAVYDAFGLGESEEFTAKNEEKKFTAEDAENAEGGKGLDSESVSAHSATSAVKPRPMQRPSFMIWTTTPWTLPANLAIAVHPRVEYALVRVDGNVTVMAAALVERVTKLAKAESVEVLATTTGDKLVGLRYRHPLRSEPAKFAEQQHPVDLNRIWSIVPAEYVTLEDGTGLVHTAPGHGAEDFATGLREGLPIYCPVLGDGAYDQSVPQWLRGAKVFDANATITARLRESGHLYHSMMIDHSYPHDWRSKTPVIFRATEQWFIGVDRPFHLSDEPEGPEYSLRQRALAAVRPRPAPGGARPPHAVDPAAGEDRVMTSDQRQSLPPADGPGSFSGKGLPAGPLGRGGRDDLSAEEFADSDVGTEPQRVAPGEPVAFVPEWGRNRMRGMLEGRPDWCISRQRAWGLPIPAFFTQEGDVLLTAASVRAVAKALREEGSDAWFKNDAEHLLRHYDVGSDPDVPPSVASSLYGGGGRSVASLTKSRDIIDVWFESGSSWNAVMRERSGGSDFPVDLYLEGSDQHRGWFQSSLLPALAMMGRPPYRAVLTHGFMVDREGHKLSKSKGHTIEQLMELHGADVLRWWVASLAYEGDVKVDEEFFKLAGESYRKVRNTLRFMLGNVGGVRGQAEEAAPRGGGVAEESARGADLPEAESLDAWVLGEYDTMARGVVEAYLRYDFKGAQQALYHFCNETLSAVYLAAVKDRLYCDAVDEPRRRRTQRTLFALTDGLCRLLAPVLCHTADEAWRELHGVEATDAERSVHLELFIEGFGARPAEAWKAAMRVRERALVALERAKERGIENPLDARLVLPDADGALATLDGRDLADICGVSLVELDPQAQEVRVEDLRERYPRCERSWKRGPDVRERSDGGVLTDRDARAVGVS